MLRRRRKIDILAAQVIRDGNIFVHRVDNDDVVVRLQIDLDGLLLHFHALAGPGIADDQAISICKPAPVADLNVAADLIYPVNDARRLIQLMDDEGGKCCKRLCQHRDEFLHVPAADR